MDSVTQIVLGAAVGEAVLGRKVGNKAMLYGAIAGTIPDLDVMASNVTDTVTALAVHRGFTHSIIFSVVFAPIFGWLVSRFETLKEVGSWTRLFFWGFITHPLLDAFTTWGTQLFWPFDVRLAFKSIFVIDPLYTLPFLIFLILAMIHKKTSEKRGKFNWIGLYISSGYLLLTLLLKWMAYHQFESALTEQKIDYKELDTRPSPLNTILWSANVDTYHAYLIGNYSFFDSNPIAFTSHPKNHQLLGDLVDNKKVQQMIAISQGWYTISQKGDDLYFNDLRFGLLSLSPDAQDFVFSFRITIDDSGQVIFTEEPKGQRDGKKLLAELWRRIKGN